jgi:WD40 repeat protein
MHILVHDDSVSSSIFNKDGSQVITYSDDSKIMTWDSETGVCLHVFSGSIF